MRQALRLLVFCVLASPLFAGTTLPTASKPVTIIPHGDIVHVFTVRVDQDYDGVQDDGDLVGVWHTFDAASRATLRTFEFPWSFGNGRPYLDASTDQMFVEVAGNVDIYRATTQQYIQAAYSLAAGVFGVYGLYYDNEDSTLYSTHRTATGGAAHVIDFRSGIESDITSVGDLPQQVVGYRSMVKGNGVALINEGAFGQANGFVKLLLSSTSPIPAGDTPNHIVVSGDSAYVTVNGSHYVVVIDLNTESAVDTIQVGTAGYNGPRESVVKDGRLIVSTYAGDVRIFEIATGERVGFIQHGPRAEGLAVVGNTLWVTRAMDSNYVAESGIEVYDLDVATSAPGFVFNQSRPLSPLSVTPSVANDVVFISGVTQAEPVRFIDTRGGVTYVPQLSSGETSSSYDVTSLPEGAYIVRQGRKTGRLIVIR